MLQRIRPTGDVQLQTRCNCNLIKCWSACGDSCHYVPAMWRESGGVFHIAEHVVTGHVLPGVTGDVREIVGQPVFVPLFKLFLTYGKIFRLSFGPKSFVVISDAAMAKQVRLRTTLS